VNLTSRIQATALGDEIVISDAVFRHLKTELKVVRSFDAQFKGIEDPVLLHVLDPAPQT